MLPEDADGGELAPDGRVMELLSEHTLLGWLEGYLLTGRHGFFHTYEAFAHVIDSMFNQHAKWLDIARTTCRGARRCFGEHPAVVHGLAAGPQRVLAPGSGLHRSRRQQEPSVDARLPAARREHAAVGRRSLPARTDYINVIVADKQKHLQFTTIDEAIVHCAKGIGIWRARSTDAGEEPDVVLASCGDVATMEALAAAAILRERSRT
jgi:xylulose-5-phosphate/fructose-6-phosphate phosphoketolase